MVQSTRSAGRKSSNGPTIRALVRRCGLMDLAIIGLKDLAVREDLKKRVAECRRLVAQLQDSTSPVELDIIQRVKDCIMDLERAFSAAGMR